MSKSDLKNETVPVAMTVPLPLARLLRRIDALADGRYAFIITKADGEVTDCTEIGSGKVESLNH